MKRGQITLAVHGLVDPADVEEFMKPNLDEPGEWNLAVHELQDPADIEAMMQPSASTKATHLMSGALL